MYINTLNIDSVRQDKAGKSIAFSNQLLNADMYQKIFIEILTKAAEISKTEAEIASKQNFTDINASIEKLTKQVIQYNKKIDSTGLRLDKIIDAAESTSRDFNDRLKKLEENN